MLSKNLQALLFKGHVTSLNGSTHVAFSLDTSILDFPRAQDREFLNELWGEDWWAKLVLFSIHKWIMKQWRTCYPTEHATNDYKSACTHVPMQQIVGCYPTIHFNHPNFPSNSKKRVLRTLSSLPTSRSTGSALSLPAGEFRIKKMMNTN